MTVWGLWDQFDFPVFTWGILILYHSVIVQSLLQFTPSDAASFVPQDMKLHYGDLTDSTCLVKIINEVKPTEVYNLGAQSHVKVSRRVPVPESPLRECAHYLCSNPFASYDRPCCHSWIVRHAAF